MRNGIIQALILYVFGFIVSWITYLVVGHPYIHAPGLHHIIGLATILLGIVWGVVAMLLYAFRGRNRVNLGIFLTNLVVFLSFFLYVFLYPYVH